MSISTNHKPKTYSCIRCFERKVKCDRLDPCSNCTKSEVECVFRVPTAPRRRKKRPPDGPLLARLKRYEELLKNNGIDIEGDHATPLSSTTSTLSPRSPAQQSREQSYDINRHPAFLQYQDAQAGKLLVDRGKSRFVENNLWAQVSASSELKPKEAIVEQYSDEEDELGPLTEENTSFVFGYSQLNSPNQHLHPSPECILLLWQIFLENVNPMTKLIHPPSLQQMIVQVSSNANNLNNGIEALMFSIYTAAVTSMNNHDCVIKLGETRKALLVRYRHATRKALAKARFMGTSDIQVLQAFVIYLVVMRTDYDSRTAWTLVGVASRIAQGMGLHRDGATLGVSPFETEMRRRLWWQIQTLDFRSAELSGTGRFREFTLSDTQPPTNVDDNEIYPDMMEPPTSHAKATEMIACLIRCEFISFWKEKVVEKSNAAFENMRILIPHALTLEERDARIDEFERRIEEKYLRYCDPMIPIQFMSILIGRSTIDSMRLSAHHERRYFSNPEDMPSSEREFLWNLCIKLIESDNLTHTTKVLYRFTWHTDVYFQWPALIYLLHELGIRVLGDQVDRAWELLDELFTHHSDFITNSRRPLHVAVGSLCLKAYSAREAALHEKTNRVFPKVAPEYIKTLREQRRHTEGAVARSGDQPNEASIRIRQTENLGQLGNQDLSSSAKGKNALHQQSTNQDFEMVQQPSSLQNFMSLQSEAEAGDVPSDQFLFTSDTELAQDLAMASMPMDWVQWDFIPQ